MKNKEIDPSNTEKFKELEKKEKVFRIGRIKSCPEGIKKCSDCGNYLC